MPIAVVFASMFAAFAPAADDAPLYTSPYFQVLGIASGLPSSRVYKTVQDRDGYLWFGTQDGLARYDGVGFRVYRNDPKDPDSIGGNAITALFVDRDNRIWCGGEESGLNLLDQSRAKFSHYRHDANDAASLGGDDVWTITQDAAGALWIGGYAGGLDRLDPGAKHFVHFRHYSTNTQSIASDNVLGLLAAKGRLWAGTDAGIDLIEPGGTVVHVDLSAVPGSGRVNAIALVEDADGAVLAGTRRGLLRIDANLHASVVAADALTDPLVYGAVAGSAAGELWIATRHGLNRRATDATVSHYLENPAVPGSFPGDTVFDVMRDREGSMWFATFEGGVAKLPASWRNFALFRNDPADPASLSGNRTQGLAADERGGIWAVNLDGGIDRLEPSGGKIERYAGRLEIPYRAMWSVLADRTGQLWVGHTRGVRVYELQSGKYRDLVSDAAKPDALAPGLVYHLAEDPSGTIWVATYGSSGGLHRIDPASFQVERFDTNNAGLRNAEVDQIGFDAGDNLLVASGAGLDRFNPASSRFVPVAGAPEQRVYAFAFAADHSLWLHVRGALEHYRVDGAALALIERVDANAGWPALTVGGLQVDGRGAVWVSGPRGLWRYDPERRSIRVFGSADGLASAEFNRLPLIRRSDGTIFGGTLSGIVGFNPAQIADPPEPPRLVLDGVVVRRHGRDLPLDPGADLALQWDDRDLRIAARALSYANPGANRYQWRLDGIDPDWVDTGNRGDREFSQLPPGNYALQLRAAAAAGVWSAPSQALRLSVAAPPWATPFAYAAYAAALVLAIVAAFRAYRQRVRRRHALELAEQQRRLAEQASAAKTRFLATMGHEIRTPMTGVLGMTELLLRTPLDAAQQGYARTILSSGQLMLRLVNDSLDLARIEAGKLQLEAAVFDLHALLGEIATAAEPMAAAKGLAWRLAISVDAPRHVRGDALRVKQIILNLVNNAIKFTDHGRVTLTLERDAAEGVELCVSDSGPGIAEPARARLFQRFEQAHGTSRNGGSGLGLAICRELVAHMGGDISLRSEPGQGCTFAVRLPLPAEPGPIVFEVHAASSAVAPPSIAPLDPAAVRILLVEDDAIVAEVLAGLLALRGHEVTRVANGLSALAAIDSESFELAFIDLDLPGIDGLALARLLRTREAEQDGARLPLVGISARSAGDEEALCLAAGMDAFLRKPLGAEQLDVAVDRLRRQFRHERPRAGAMHAAPSP